jgi:hypothetical protein
MPQDIITKDSNANAVVNWADDPFATLANNMSAQEGEYLKFAKNHWTSGKDEEPMDGKELVADLTNLMIGCRRWENKKITDQHAGLVADGYRPPQRNDLGDLDESKWEVDANGKRKDRWVYGFYLQLVDPVTGEAYVWTASSHGAKQEIGNFVRAFTKQRKKNPAYTVPVVKLASDYYRHKDYGRVDVPKLEIVDWRSSETVAAIPAPDGSDDAEMNDAIPF